MVSALVMGISTHPLRIWHVAVFMILPQVSGVLMVLFIPFMSEYGEYGDDGDKYGRQDARSGNQAHRDNACGSVSFHKPLHETQE